MTDTTDRQYRPLVYICSPYSGDTETNIKKAREFCRYALEQGQIPLAPHLMFPQFMKDIGKNIRNCRCALTRFFISDILNIGKRE